MYLIFKYFFYGVTNTHQLRLSARARVTVFKFFSSKFTKQCSFGITFTWTLYATCTNHSFLKAAAAYRYFWSHITLTTVTVVVVSVTPSSLWHDDLWSFHTSYSSQQQLHDVGWKPKPPPDGKKSHWLLYLPPADTLHTPTLNYFPLPPWWRSKRRRNDTSERRGFIYCMNGSFFFLRDPFNPRASWQTGGGMAL